MSWTKSRPNPGLSTHNQVFSPHQTASATSPVFQLCLFLLYGIYFCSLTWTFHSCFWFTVYERTVRGSAEISVQKRMLGPMWNPEISTLRGREQSQRISPQKNGRAGGLMERNLEKKSNPGNLSSGLTLLWMGKAFPASFQCLCGNVAPQKIYLHRRFLKVSLKVINREEICLRKEELHCFKQSSLVFSIKVCSRVIVTK